MRVCVRIRVRASSYFLNNVAAERSEEGNKFQGAVVKYYLPKTSLHRRRLNAAERARCSISERWRSFRRRRASGRLFARLTALLWSSGKATFGKLPYLPVMPHGCGRVIRGPWIVFWASVLTCVLKTHSWMSVTSVDESFPRQKCIRCFVNHSYAVLRKIISTDRSPDFISTFNFAKYDRMWLLINNTSCPTSV